MWYNIREDKISKQNNLILTNLEKIDLKFPLFWSGNLENPQIQDNIVKKVIVGGASGGIPTSGGRTLALFWRY